MSIFGSIVSAIFGRSSAAAGAPPHLLLHLVHPLLGRPHPPRHLLRRQPQRPQSRCRRRKLPR
jgi:hypothetical protein